MYAGRHVDRRGDGREERREERPHVWRTSRRTTATAVTAAATPTPERSSPLSPETAAAATTSASRRSRAEDERREGRRPPRPHRRLLVDARVVLDRPERELGRREQAGADDDGPSIHRRVARAGDHVPRADRCDGPRDAGRRAQRDREGERRDADRDEALGRRCVRPAERDRVRADAARSADGEERRDQARASRAWRLNEVTSSSASCRSSPRRHSTTATPARSKRCRRASRRRFQIR